MSVQMSYWYKRWSELSVERGPKISFRVTGEMFRGRTAGLFGGTAG